MKQRGGTDAAQARAAAVPSTFRQEPSPDQGANSPAPTRNERQCIAFLVNPGRTGVASGKNPPRLWVPVARLGRRDAALRYWKRDVRVAYRGRTCHVWLNIPPAAVEQMDGQEPLIGRNQEGGWQPSKDAVDGPEWPDYVAFCKAANSSGIAPQPITLSRRWFAAGKGTTPGKERRLTTPPTGSRTANSPAAARRPKADNTTPTDPGERRPIADGAVPKVRAENGAGPKSRGRSAPDRRANYYDVLGSTSEDGAAEQAAEVNSVESARTPAHRRKQ